MTTKVLLRPLLAALLLSLPSGLAAQAQGKALAAWQREGSLVLLSGSGGSRLELPDGHRLDLELPAAVELSALAALEGGWIAAGTAPVAGKEKGGGEGPARRELLLLAGDRRSFRSLPLPDLARPALGGERFRLGAVPLVEAGRLQGLAWLAGDGPPSLAVWAAPWLAAAGQSAAGAGRWGKPELVSPPGPGSQLALAGTVLADGSWLLAWSAFDGGDDEIVSARRRGGSWERPRRAAADNPVPDITPALFATGDGGAFLAWSRYDGSSYRLHLARFAEGEWSGEKAVGGPGSLYPSFAGAEGECHLLYLEAASGSWRVSELGPQGDLLATRALAAPAAAAAGAGEPALVRTPAGALTLRWPGEGGAER